MSIEAVLMRTLKRARRIDRETLFSRVRSHLEVPDDAELQQRVDHLVENEYITHEEVGEVHLYDYVVD